MATVFKGTKQSYIDILSNSADPELLFCKDWHHSVEALHV